MQAIDRFYLVQGKGIFVDDLKFNDMLYLKVIRSPYARANILKLRGGINGYELKASMIETGETADEVQIPVEYPVLATKRVNFLGQPVAAVLGKDPYDAEDKAEEVEVEYEPLKPIVDVYESLNSEPIHEEMKNNIFYSAELGEKFEHEAPVIISDKLSNERVIPNPIETRGLIAYYNGDMLTIWGSTQSVHSWREGFASILKIPLEKIRVIQTYTGGAFGSKSSIYPEYVIAAYASIKTKRPVKWIETRSEHLIATEQGRGIHAELTLGARRDGKILWIDGRIIVDAGAYPLSTAAFMPKWVAYQISGPYAIQKQHFIAISVCTNKVPLGPYRGAGRPEAAFFMERMMDLLADELKKDPVEVRMANLIEEKFESPLKLKVPPAKKFFEEAINKLGYYEKVKEGKKVGISFFLLIPAIYGGETARILVEDGKVKVWLGGNVHGQEHEEFVKSIIKEELEIDENLIELEAGDTNMIPSGIGAWGSRSAILAGSALIEAARKIKQRVIEKEGKYSKELLLKGKYDEFVHFSPKASLNSLGANLVVASIKEGIIKIEEVVSYYDVGKALNKEAIENQIIGGTIQGISQVFTEAAIYNEEGQLIPSNIIEAGVFSSLEIPSKIIPLFTEIPSEMPSKAKGVGESPTIGVPPATVRAIEQLINKRLRKTPIDLSDWIRTDSIR